MSRLLLIPMFGFAVFAHAAEPLGRLFYTPQQRSQLDTARLQKNQAVLAAESQEAALPQVITYRGMVKRSDGRSTLWVNDRAISNPEALSAMSINGRVSPSGSVTIQFPQSNRSAELKVGQSAELISGVVEDAFARAPSQVRSEVREDTAAPAKKAEAPAPAAREKPAASSSGDTLQQAVQLQKALDDMLRSGKPTAPQESGQGK